MSQRARSVFTALYVACAVVFLIGVAGFYRPGLGFTSMVQFGEHFAPTMIPELRHEPHFVVAGAGYDGQFYAQLAAKPVPWDPEVQRALDDAPYRSSRILMPLLAHVLAGGNPVRAMHVYAVMNVVIWFVLAWLLLYWFPPGTLWDFACWAGVLFSAGTMMAVCRALTDLPAFVCVVVAMKLWERGRPNAAAAALGLAGFVRQTAIVAVAVVAEKPKDRHGAWKTLKRGVLVVLPAAVLALAFRLMLGKSDVAAGNFDVPFAGVLGRFALVAHEDFVKSAGVVATMLSLVVQGAFFAFRPRLSDARHRLGAAYFVLLAFTAEPIWAGYPGSAPRILLPLLLAFNLAVPRLPRFWPLLVLGNLSVVTGWHNLMHPPRLVATSSDASAQTPSGG